MSGRRRLGLAEVTAAAAAPAPAGAEEMVFLSARVPRSLRVELQHAATDQGRPLAELVRDAVRVYLDHQH